MQSYRIAHLRRLYMHVLNGGKLNEIDLAYTEGATSADDISRLIQRLEYQDANPIVWNVIRDALDAELVTATVADLTDAILKSLKEHRFEIVPVAVH